MVGEALRIWAAGHLEKGREVTASGPYRLSRHPLYLGSAIIGVGFAVASASAAAAALVLVYLALTLRRRDPQRGGAPDREVRRRVPGRTGRAARRRPQRRFSLERAIRNREYRAAAGLLLVLALLAWKVL